MCFFLGKIISSFFGGGGGGELEIVAILPAYKSP